MGDAMSLLLCFFVMMLNFGSLHSDELANLFGVLSGGNEIMPVTSTGQLVPRHQSKDTDAADVVIRKSQVPARVNDLQRKLATSGFQHHISIEQLRNGLRVQISESLLFGNTNELTDDGRKALVDLVNLFQGTGNEIRLTAAAALDDAESARVTARAEAVAEYLVAEGDLRRERFGLGSQVGSADQQEPVFTVLLMEKAGTKKLRFADLWNKGEWQ